jgi:hypothetical protein
MFCIVAKRLCVLVVVVVALMVMAPARSEAATDLGQLCWSLTTFNDQFRCSLMLMDGTEPLIGLFCSDRAAGAYEGVGSGLMRLSFPTAGSLQFSFTGTHNTINFGGNKTCSYNATLSVASGTGFLGGPLAVECPGGSTTPKFTYSSTMVLGACTPTTSPDVPPVGRGIGQ